MPRLMADHDVRGHLAAIVRFLRSDGLWKSFWDDASVTVLSLETVGLDQRSTDLVVWQTCQSQQIVLFTGNRNQDEPESLEETIRTLNQDDSLPVITLGDPIRFLHDGQYAERAAVKVLDYLTNLDNYRGAGRLYVP